MGHSKHKVGGKVIKIPRKWDDLHIGALYHEQEWGEHATPDHELIGTHNTDLGTFEVEYVEDFPQGAGGPEFLIKLPSGDAVVVLCADVVRQYLQGAHLD